nr:MAG TPA: hypothetical protein [Caudoviricetes sp.]
MLPRRGGFSLRRSQLLKFEVAKVNALCYHGFARYIKALLTRAILPGSGFC